MASPDAAPSALPGATVVAGCYERFLFGFDVTATETVRRRRERWGRGGKGPGQPSPPDAERPLSPL
jgi:hypothetical protein